MKNVFLMTLASAGLLFATSCSQDELQNNVPQVIEEVTAKFTIDAFDGINTRAIGDGTSVTHVTCAVFDEDGNEADLRQDVEIDNKTAQYTVRLVKGQGYRVVFFAHKLDAGHYDVTDMKNISINTASSNVEERDAFTNYIDIPAERTLTAIDTTVCLYRPLAQLNIGSTEEDRAAAESAGIVLAKTQVKVSNIYNAFNAHESVVAGDPTEVTFVLNDVPSEKLIVDEEEYTYHALNYLLVGDTGSEKSLTDVEFIWETENGVKTNASVPTVFHNIPVQRNYRTNILGYVLTNPAEFCIVISPWFKKPDYNVNFND